VFGIFFIFIAISIAIAAIISEIVSIKKASFYYHLIKWVGSFAITFISLFHDKLTLARSIKKRMENTKEAKVLNGVCWAGPFATIAIFPYLLPYLVLIGIGLGNVSTYVLLKIFNRISNQEQLIVGLVSIAAIPIVYGVHLDLLVVKEDIAIILSRIFVSFAYALGGIYALRQKPNQ
jgi:hypothetical protein